MDVTCRQSVGCITILEKLEFSSSGKVRKIFLNSWKDCEFWLEAGNFNAIFQLTTYDMVLRDNNLERSPEVTWKSREYEKFKCWSLDFHGEREKVRPSSQQIRPQEYLLSIKCRYLISPIKSNIKYSIYAYIYGGCLKRDMSYCSNKNWTVALGFYYFHVWKY